MQHANSVLRTTKVFAQVMRRHMLQQQLGVELGMLGGAFTCRQTFDNACAMQVGELAHLSMGHTRRRSAGH